MKTEKDARGESPLDERREQIKKAALAVFARLGVAGAKMSLIAAEAGISQGLSYRYFSSKEEIFTLLVQEAIEESGAAIRGVPLLPGSPKEQLKQFTLRMLDESHKHYFLLLQHALTSEDVPAQAKELVRRYSPEETIAHLVPVFVKGQQAGEFREGDPRRLLYLYFSVITGLMLQDSLAAQGYWASEIDLLMRVILR